MKKRLFLLFALLLILMGAQTVSATEIKEGLLEPEAIEFPKRMAEDDVLDADRIAEMAQETLAEADKWDAYTSYYYYNQLSPQYRKSWDNLDVICKSYFDETKNVTDANGCMETVKLPDGMTMDEMREFWGLFVYSNPQYYFIKNQYYYYSKTENGVKYPTQIALTMYPAFYQGGTRAAETAKIETLLATWQAQIDACATDVEKLQKIQELICTKVDYNYDAANRLVEEEDSFSQSAYSVFCKNLTVCAGYADAFSMLCNASGIDAVSVTSGNHQWNKVRIDDSWYNCDATWDDRGADNEVSIIYRYFGRSDDSYERVIDAGDADAIYSHTLEAFWEKYRPLCTLDTDPDSWPTVPGTFPTITQKVLTPEISVSYGSGEPQVTLSCGTSNTDLYYTTDGTTPAVAANKSYKYEGVFEAEADMPVKVIAACDTYWDSEVAGAIIELEKYEITYYLKGGVNHEDNPQTYTVRDTIQLQAPSKTGYIFEGWYLDEEYTEKVTQIKGGSSGPLALYAQWSPISYNIRFDGNEATNGSMSSFILCVYDTEYVLDANTYEREGYVFNGWNTEADGSGISYADEEIVKNLAVINGATVTLYAQWDPMEYTIYLDGNGAEAGAMSPVEDCEYDQFYTLPANKYERTAYVFNGWNTNADGSGISYADEEMVKNLSISGDVTLYAQWRPIRYSIAFDGNGATAGEMDGLSDCEYNMGYALPDNEYECIGYVFTCWNTQADGNGISYDVGDEVRNLSLSDGANITLYAQWKKIIYTIVFDGNGATAGEMPSMDACEYDAEYTVSANTYERTGYTFGSWNTKVDGTGTVYADEATVSNLAVTDGADATLYAQWNPITYHILFDGNGADDGSMNAMENCKYDTEYSLDANAYRKAGYAFAGWNTQADGSGVSYKDEASAKNLTVTAGEEIVLYAQWQIITYTISFDGNGATAGEMPLMDECEYGQTYTLTANTFARNGYTFAGWNTAANGSGDTYADGETVENLAIQDDAKVLLFAQWKPISYTISFDGNGATSGTMDDMENCVYDTSYKLTANNYEKTGYLFAGWTTEADADASSYADKEAVSNLTAKDGAEVILYAKWTPISYTVIFDGNGATGGETKVLTCEYDRAYKLTANAYRKTGYEFAGWNTKADGSGDSYTDQETVNNLMTEDGAQFTLFAQWKAITYKVQFDGNGATGGETGTLVCNYDDSYEIPSNGYERSGYTFTGWNSKEDGSGTKYAEGNTFENLSATEDAIVTLYAQWTANIYNVTFDGNGATEGAMGAMTNLSRGTSYELSVNGYQYSGYTFTGWNTKADGSGDSYADGAEIYNLNTRNTDTIALYAQWSPIAYKVTFDGNGATSGETDILTCKYDSVYLLSANGFVRTGYIFAGWNTKADGSGTTYSEKEEIKNVTTVDDATVILYAQWSPIAYKVTFDGNGATSGATDALTCKYDSSFELSVNGFLRTGYVFSGWNTKADGSGAAYSEEEIKNLTTDSDATIILYAQWKAIEYKVIFDGNGATSGATAALTACKYDSSYMLSANGFVKTGHTFAGWNTKANGSGTAYTNKTVVKNLTSTDGAVLTLYAQWKTNSYTIKFDGNKAGKGSMNSMTSLLYGRSYGLASNNYKRTGYRFTGWNTAKNGKGVSVKNKASVQSLSEKDGGVVVLYAQWKANKYTVKFHGNGATSGSMKKMKNRTYNKKFKLSANKYKREGYKFIGWNTKKNGKGKMYKNKAKVKNLTSKNGKTVTLYAQWKKI